MSLRVHYRVSCDRCEGLVLEHDMRLPRDVQPPRLAEDQIAGMDLCTTCAPLVRAALAKCMDRRSEPA